MRLFIAINFDEKSKNAIQQISDEVKKHCKQGRFVKSQHLHLRWSLKIFILLR